MKKVLITGKKSYIGTSLENWLNRDSDKYEVVTIDMKDESWYTKDFSVFDVVFHVAGIAHIKESRNNEHTYFEVNREMALKVAKKSRDEGVKQFIFMSSMSVYGVESGFIRLNSPLNPKTTYGKSKLEAEVLIKELGNDIFRIAILRPPMVYGPSCKGNYQRLSSLARVVPLFPDIDNRRSMIYIDNLTEFVRQLIDVSSKGLFFPQNADYVTTSEMVKLVAEVHGKKVVLTKLFNPIIRKLSLKILKKLFNDLAYEMNMSGQPIDYEVCTFAESIKRTEAVIGVEE